MTTDRQRRFGGIARLYGSDALARFGRARIAVAGVGGVGSWAVEALARSGIGALTLFDLDHVVESNVNRQLHATESDFGKAKVRALAERIAQIDPHCEVEPVELFVEPENLDALIGNRFDWVVDCIDGFRNKAALLGHCRRHRVPVVTAGGAGGLIDPTRIRIADLARTTQDPLLSKTRRLLRADYGFPRNPKRRFEIPSVYSDEPRRPPQTGSADCGVVRGGGLHCGGFGSAMSVTATFGLVAVAEVLRRLAAGRPDQ